MIAIPPLLLGAALAAAPPVELVVSHERIELPVPAGAATVRWSPIEKRLTLELPAGRAAAVARRIDGASKLCAGARVSGGAVVLTCRTGRLRAGLDGRTGHATLELHELSVFSWREEEDGPPLTALDPAALGEGSCPGTTPEARGECALAAGDREAALRAFEEARSAHAELRLGDLALAADDPTTAVRHWRLARGEAPWGRLAAERMCELEPACLDGPHREPAFDVEAADPSVRADLAVRTVRLRALAGEVSAAVTFARDQLHPGGACGAARAFCRRLLWIGLGRPPPDGTLALAAWLDLPDRADGPLGLDLTRRAADQAEASGAPAFAATLLAAAAGAVPPAELPQHLLRTARLYLAGRDRARADEIVAFARTRVSSAEWSSPAWQAVRRALRAADRPAAAPDRSEGPPPELGAARAAADAARLVTIRRAPAR